MGFANPQATRTRVSSFTPANYTPIQTGTEGANKVSAHLKGIDSALGSSGSVVLTGQTVGGGVSTGDPVYWDGTSWKKATTSTDKPTGFKNGTSGEVVIAGEATGLSGLTAGEDYYLGYTGGLTKAKEGQYIGVALSSTSLSVTLDDDGSRVGAPTIYDKQVATSGQTVFTVQSYSVGTNSLWVFVNGLRQTVGSDYTETDSITVTFSSGLLSGDEVLFTQLGSGATNLLRNEFTSTAGQTIFNLTFNYIPGANEIIVFLNGVLQRLTSDYTETDGNTITFVTGRSLNEKIDVFKISNATTSSTVGKNAIINGDMRIAQRGTSLTTSTTTQLFLVDRFRHNVSLPATITISQDTDVPSGEGFYHSLKTAVGTADTIIDAGDFNGIAHPIEGYNFSRFVGKRATLSFWVKSTKTGTMSVVFNNGTDRSYVTEVTINTASTWEKKSVTLDFDYSGGTWNYTNGKGLLVWFVFMSGSTWNTSTLDTWLSSSVFASTGQTNFMDSTSNIVWITGVQLELGPRATNFEFLDYSLALRQCERYYQLIRLYGYGGNLGQVTSSNTIRGPVHFHTEMRTPPTVTMPPAGKTSGSMAYLGTGGSFPAVVGSHTAYGITTSVMEIRGTGYSGGGFVGGYSSILYGVGSVAIKLDAEL